MSGDGSTDTEAVAAAPPAPDPSPQPDAFRLRGAPPRVVRLSRRALIILGTVSAAGIGGALVYALSPHQTGPQAAELLNTDGHNTAEKLASMPKRYDDVPKLGPPLPGDLGRPIVNAQNQGKLVTAPDMGSASTANPAANARMQAQQKAVQLRDAARESKLFTGSGSPQAAMAAAEPAPSSSSSSAPPPINMSGADANGQDAKRAFMSQSPDRRTASMDRLEPPSSPDILQAGSIIPAALITGLRSDLPGQITAQVTQNVYDSPTGHTLLIPQGARLIGEYDSSVTFGQRRLLMAWTRLILPDGRSIPLEREPGTDAAGYAGLEDRVNNHWGQVFKAAILSTLLSVGSEAGTSQSENNLAQAIRAGAANGFSQAGQQVVERQLNIQPTLTIRPGFPVQVMVTRDLVLTPWHQDKR